MLVLARSLGTACCVREPWAVGARIHRACDPAILRLAELRSLKDRSNVAMLRKSSDRRIKDVNDARVVDLTQERTRSAMLTHAETTL